VRHYQESSQGQGLRLHHSRRRRRRGLLSPLAPRPEDVFRRPARGQRSPVRSAIGREGAPGLQRALAVVAKERGFHRAGEPAGPATPPSPRYDAEAVRPYLEQSGPAQPCDAAEVRGGAMLWVGRPSAGRTSPTRRIPNPHRSQANQRRNSFAANGVRRVRLYWFAILRITSAWVGYG